MRRATLLILPITLTAACGDEIHDALVQPALAPCTGLENRLCMVISENGGAPGLFHEGIEGYTFRWGVESRIRYSVEELDDPPADGSSRRYHLEQTVDEEIDAPGTTYELTFPAQPGDGVWFSVDSASPGTLVVGGTRVTCEQAVCDLLLEGTATSALHVTFELTSMPLAPLRAIAATR